MIPLRSSRLLSRTVAAPCWSGRMVTQPRLLPHHTFLQTLSARHYSSAEPSSTERPKKAAHANTEAPTKPKSIFARMFPANTDSSSFPKLIALAKPEKGPLTISIGLLTISSAISMSVPLLVGKLIDFYSTVNPQIPFGLTVWQTSAILGGVFTVGAIANAGRAYIMKMAGQRIVARLREDTYVSALRQEVEFVERGEGDVLSRLSVDTSIVGESITGNLSDGLRAAFMSTISLGAMFYISPQLTLAMLAVVPPVSFGAVFYGRYLRKLSNQTQEAVGEMTKGATEALSALRTVQAFNAEDQEREKFHGRITGILELARKEAVATGIFWGSSGWSGNLTLLGLLAYGGSLVAAGELTIGSLSSLMLYTAYVGSGLQMLISFFTSLMRGLGAGSRIFELLDRKSLIPHNTGVALTPHRRGSVRFENIRFEYPSRKGIDILKNFNLEMSVGESVAIVGSSGSGKSSVQSLLLRYYNPVQGRITFDGQDIREFTVSSWRDAIGLVPQDPVLFTGTIASNIAYGRPEATREEIEKAARLANCEFIWGMPQGFDTPIGRLSLSGGQRQRLAIARALLKKPAILALDEATSSLDATSEHRVNDAVDKILASKQVTCLFVAHRLSTIARAERIVVLEDGQITESGTYRELVNKPDSRFRNLMAAQLTAASKDVPGEATDPAVLEEEEVVHEETQEVVESKP